MKLEQTGRNGGNQKQCACMRCTRKSRLWIQTCHKQSHAMQLKGEVSVEAVKLLHVKFSNK